MGNSAVLKDLKNRLAGYMRKTQDEVICRAQLDAPAQLVLVFLDGSQIMHEMEEGSGEQHFSCQGELVGCYVIRGDELLMFSDESMRRAFEGRMFRERRPEPRLQECGTLETHTQHNDVKNGEETQSQTPPAFAQRRWPPPPCWETARYMKGCWQEE